MSEADRSLVTRPDFIQNYELSSTSQKALGWLDNKFTRYAGRFLPTVAALQWFRGDDPLKGMMQAERRYGGNVNAVTTDHERKNQVFLLHHSGGDNYTDTTIDPLAKHRDPKKIIQGQDGMIFDMPEDDMYLSTVSHRCGGRGPCVPAALWNLQDGKVRLGGIASKLQQIKYMEDENNRLNKNVLENPFEGVGNYTLTKYLSSLGYSHISQGNGAASLYPPEPAGSFEELINTDWFERAQQSKPFGGYMPFDDLMVHQPNSFAVVKPKRDWSIPMSLEEAMSRYLSEQLHAIQVRDGKPVEASRRKRGELAGARLKNYYVKTHEGDAYQGVPRPPESVYDSIERDIGNAHRYANETRPIQVSSFGRNYDQFLDAEWLKDSHQ